MRSNKLQREHFAFICFIHCATPRDFISFSFAAKNNFKTTEFDDLLQAPFSPEASDSLTLVI